MTWNLANQFSLLRILLIPAFVTALLYYTPKVDTLRLVALAIFFIAVITDAVDGYIARVWGLRTSLGVILDPIADKLLLISAFVLFASAPPLIETFKLPVWVSIVVVSRDLILVLGTVLIYVLTGTLCVNPTIWGKLTTVSQMLTVFALLTKLAFAPIVWSFAVGLTVISGIDYVAKGSRLINGK